MIEQFVMAYGIEQDRIRALLPEGYTSLRPVLRINAEIRDEKSAYLEFNTPVAHGGKRGWLNIAHWQSPEVAFRRENGGVILSAPFLHLTYKGVGIAGGCPAEKDNDGCFFPGEDPAFRPAERITERKEFCDCEFAWRFHAGDASGVSIGKTLPALPEEVRQNYPTRPLTAANAAAIPCRQVLGAYIVRFQRQTGPAEGSYEPCIERRDPHEAVKRGRASAGQKGAMGNAAIDKPEDLTCWLNPEALAGFRKRHGSTGSL